MPNKIVNFIMLPFRFKILRLNRMQHFFVQMTLNFLLLFFSFIMQSYYALDKKVSLSAVEITVFVFGLLFVAFWIIISVCAHIARLHDCNKSGWWVWLIYLLNCIALFIPTLLLYVWPGDKGENKYGKSNKAWAFFKF